jgi:membrane protein DedA with SNARE-associated domain
MRPIAAVSTGLGIPAALALLVPMEAGIPIPIPADILILFVGERAAAGSIPLWLAVLGIEGVAIIGTTALFLACRGAGHALVARFGARVGLTDQRLARFTGVVERRGSPALALGRGTPGLRTLTVIAAGGSGLSARRALVPLVIGSSAFLQLHLLLGYFLGPPARDLVEAATIPAILGAVILLLGAAVFWFVRRGRRGGEAAWAEAACPACLVLGALGEHTVEREAMLVR